MITTFRALGVLFIFHLFFLLARFLFFHVYFLFFAMDIVVLFNHLGNGSFSPRLPFLAVGQGIVQVFIARHTKYTALFELFGQGNLQEQNSASGYMQV
jgi:hypothetical protein